MSSIFYRDHLEQVNTKVSLISKIIDYTIQNKLLFYNKIIPKWENLLHFYNFQNTEKEGDMIKLTFDSYDLELVLKSKKLDNSEKLQILKNCPEEIIITNNNLKLLSLILLKQTSFSVNDNILNSILINNHVPNLERIKLFIKTHQNMIMILLKLF